MSDWEVIHGDATAELRQFAPEQIDAIVTDPPYGLEFMGREWDTFKPAKGKWGEREHAPTLVAEDDTPHHRSAVRQPPVLSRCERCGGNSSGQWNRCACDAPDFRKPLWPTHAFQSWCESWASECLRVLKPGGHLLAFGGTRTYHRMVCAIEDAGFEIRDSLHWIYGSGFPKSHNISKAIDKAAGAEREVITTRKGARKQWEGWGTALKPAHEPIILARKPLTGTVAANVLEHGTGALNIDGCRIGTETRVNPPAGNKPGGASYNMSVVGMPTDAEARTVEGRWPPNILLTHSPDCTDPAPCAPDCPVAEMDRQSSTLKVGYGEGASRFFPVFRYQAKASKCERPTVPGISAHPTVKPLGLMRWLGRLVTPPGGLILDPFAGTGTTAEAAILEGFDCVLIEREADYLKLIDARMAPDGSDVRP